jgi:hypothetical protein
MTSLTSAKTQEWALWSQGGKTPTPSVPTTFRHCKVTQAPFCVGQIEEVSSCLPSLSGLVQLDTTFSTTGYESRCYKYQPSHFGRDGGDFSAEWGEFVLLLCSHILDCSSLNSILSFPLLPKSPLAVIPKLFEVGVYNWVGDWPPRCFSGKRKLGQVPEGAAPRVFCHFCW